MDFVYRGVFPLMLMSLLQSSAEEQDAMEQHVLFCIVVPNMRRQYTDPFSVMVEKAS